MATEPDWMAELVRIVARLRAPDGCPWDREQTHQSLKRYALEEAAELADAIEDADDEAVAEELGDVLLQVLLHCQIAAERGRYDLQAVAHRLCTKLVRRHPHVFGDRKLATSAAVLEQWQEIKWEEGKSKEREGQARPAGALAGVPRHLSALHRAHKVQKKAARVGFDWPNVDGVVGKIEEELAEVRDALRQQDRAAVGREIGDLLFSVVNLSRFTDHLAEDLLHETVRKFERRFARLEAWLAETGKTPDQCSLEELDALWNRAKAEETANGANSRNRL